MSSFDKYIEKLVNGEIPSDDEDFPKNESLWEELFDFGKRRINEIVELKKEIIRLQSLLKNNKELDKGLWYYSPCKTGHTFTWGGNTANPDSEPPEGLPCACGQTFYHRRSVTQSIYYAMCNSRSYRNSYCGCKVFIPSGESTFPICRTCGRLQKTW